MSKKENERQALLNAILNEKYNTMYKTAYQELRNAEDAKDVVQQTTLKFIRAFDRISKLTKDALKGYLYSILQNEIRNFKRDRFREKTISLEGLKTEPADPVSLEDHVFGKFGEKIVEECMLNLSPEYATYISMSMDENITTDMISISLGVKKDSLRMVASRAREELRKSCESKGVEVEGYGRKKRKRT